jgi:hypothetical protein
VVGIPSQTIPLTVAGIIAVAGALLVRRSEGAATGR